MGMVLDDRYYFCRKCLIFVGKYDSVNNSKKKLKKRKYYNREILEIKILGILGSSRFFFWFGVRFLF